MWNTRSISISVRLPSQVADAVAEVQEADPDFLSRVIQYGMTRRSIYNRLREDEGHIGAGDAADAHLNGAAPFAP